MATIDTLDLLLREFDVHTTETVVKELEATGGYADRHGSAAETVLDHRTRFTVHHIEEGGFSSSRVDHGEGSCAVLTNDMDADFFLTDDFRALPELQTLVDAHVAISPLVLRALVQRGVLAPEEAKHRLAKLAESRDWLDAPIYRRARP